MLKSWKVRLALVAAVLFLALALGLGWLWAQRVALAERVIGQALADRGITPVSFNVGFIGLRSISLSDISIGDSAAPDATAAGVTVNYSLGELLSGKVRSVNVDEARLRILFTKDGLSLGALDPLLQGEGGSKLNLPSVVVDDAEILATTPYGGFAFSGPASVAPEGEAIVVSSGALDIADAAAEPRFAPLLANGLLRVDGRKLGFTASVASAAGQAEPVPLFEAEGSYDGEMRSGRAVAEGALSFARNGLTLASLAPALSSLYLDLGGGVAYRMVAEMQEQNISLTAEADLDDFSLSQTAAGSFSFSGKVDAAGGLEGNVLKPLRVSLRSLQLRDTSEPLRFAPVLVDGPVDYTQGSLSADLVLRSALPSVFGARLANITASYDIGAGRGQARANGSLTFTPGKLELQTLLPYLKGKVARMSGNLAYSARADMKDGSFSSSAEAKFDKVGFVASAATVEDVNGTVTLSSLLPPQTKGVQTLKVATLEAGIPLRDGTVAFELDRTGLRIVDASWPFADGKLTLVSSSTAVNADNAEFLLTVKDVDLAVLVALADVPGLQVTGHINGQVPVAMKDGDPILMDGNIAAEDQGIIVYRGEAADAAATEQTKLLTDALQNFHYTELAGGLSGNANGNLALRLSLKGANPDLYDGYPFALNVTLEGSLADLLRHGTVGFRPLELIKEQSKGALQPPANKTEP